MVECARMPPSIPPTKTTPGTTVIAADSAALQPRPVPQAGVAGGGAYQTRSPVFSFTA